MCLCFQSYKEKDAGKVVVYTTTMGIIRDTYQACMKVKQILRTLLVKFEERDVFMSTEYQNEIRERMRCDQILIPQVYIDGQHCGVIKTFLRLFTKLITYFFIYSQDAETIERLNESGELRKLLRAYKVSLLLKNIELLTNLRNIHRILMHAIHVKCAEDTDFCHAESAMEARSRSIETILPLSLLH